MRSATTSSPYAHHVESISSCSTRVPQGSDSAVGSTAPEPQNASDGKSCAPWLEPETAETLVAIERLTNFGSPEAVGKWLEDNSQALEQVSGALTRFGSRKRERPVWTSTATLEGKRLAKEIDQLHSRLKVLEDSGEFDSASSAMHDIKRCVRDLEEIKAREEQKGRAFVDTLERLLGYLLEGRSRAARLVIVRGLETLVGVFPPATEAFHDVATQRGDLAVRRAAFAALVKARVPMG